VVRDCRLADIEAPPAEVVLEELRRAKVAGERHLHCDHTVPIAVSPGRRLDLDNMQTLCDWCHRRKTMREMASGGVVPPSPPRLVGERTCEMRSDDAPRAR
jgi:5-methylcytosine-specific restriction endonuclease McrA